MWTRSGCASRVSSPTGPVRSGGVVRGPGETLLTFDADSLSTVDSLDLVARGTWRDTARAVVSSGAAVVHLRVAGALDSLAIGGLGTLEHLAVGEWRVPAAGFRGGYEPGTRSGVAGVEGVPLVWTDVTADSIGFGAMGFGAPRASLRGRTDSLQWSGRTRIGDLSAVVAGGRFARDTTGIRQIGVDSFAVRLPGGVWFLRAPVTLRLGDSVLAVDSVALQRVNGPGHLRARGNDPDRRQRSHPFARRGLPARRRVRPGAARHAGHGGQCDRGPDDAWLAARAYV